MKKPTPHPSPHPHTYTITVAGTTITVTRKKVKHLRMTIHRDTTDVTISAPWRCSRHTVENFAHSKSQWMLRTRARLQQSNRPLPPTLETGQTLRLWGRPFTLQVRIAPGKPTLILEGDTACLTLNKNGDLPTREAAFKQALKNYFQGVIDTAFVPWQEKMGVAPARIRTRYMTTRWGSYSAKTRTISMNVNLVHYHPDALEYVIVHELAHITELNHSQKFWAIVNHHLPDWRRRKALLTHA